MNKHFMIASLIKNVRVIYFVNIANRLSNWSYLNLLTVMLGASFQLSLALTNVLFYLLAVSGITLLLISWKAKREIYIKILFSPLWILLTIWVLLLYFSLLYSETNDLMMGYSRKYVKYLLLLPLVVPILFVQSKVNMPISFFRGFVWGGVLSFSLSILNKTTGILSWGSSQGWFPLKYVKNDYWMSIDPFAYAIFMAILFAYGLILCLQDRKISALLLCGIGLLGVFVVSVQRTGFVALIILAIWICWMNLPMLRKRVGAISCVLGIIIVIFMTSNSVSSRAHLALNEWTTCQADAQDIQQLGRTCYTSLGLRKFFYSESIERIGDSWVYGHGMGNLGVKSLYYDQKNQNYALKTVENPHNEYLLQGVQLGLIGLALLTAIFMTAYVKSMKLKSPHGNLYAGTILMYTVSCMFNSFLLDSAQGLFFVLVLAFIIAESIAPKDQGRA